MWPAKGAQTLSVKVEGRVDASILRCVAKIAFNYLAGIAGRDLLLEPAFCPTRRFIRYEEHPGYPVVVVDEQPTLIGDLPRKRQTIGHLVTVDWTIDQRSICSQVSLFNHARYRIILVRDYPGVWRPIQSGHHFNIQKRVVEPLHASSLVLP